METVDIFPLTQQAIAKLLGDRDADGSQGHPGCQRKTPRWPFPGTVELWLPADEPNGERYELASSDNLSLHGIGVRFEEPMEPGLALGIAFHEPEASFHGRAVVRHCKALGDGSFYIGMQFQFNDN